MLDVTDAAAAIGRAGPPLARAGRRAFYTVLVLTLLMFAALMAPFLIIPIAWPFLAAELGVHQFHDIAVATNLWFLVGGLLAQLRSAERQIGAMQQVLLFLIVFIGMTAIGRPATLLTPSPIYLALILCLVVAGLHPARAELLRLRLRMDPVLGGLALLAAAPLLVYARGQVRLDHSALPLAVHGGHWTAMAAAAVAIFALALLAATRPRGWRVPVWSVGGAALLLGTASAALPHMPSSAGPVRGVLLALWGITFVVMAEKRLPHVDRRPHGTD